MPLSYVSCKYYATSHYASRDLIFIIITLVFSRGVWVQPLAPSLSLSLPLFLSSCVCVCVCVCASLVFYSPCLEKFKDIPVNSKNDEHNEKKLFLYKEQ